MSAIQKSKKDMKCLVEEMAAKVKEQGSVILAQKKQVNTHSCVIIAR